MSSSAATPAAAAEQRMRALIAQGKWRQARNDLKSLVKSDRARFLPLLIDANAGLAREMLANGQTAQARQVVDYLATIAPAERLGALKLELAAGSTGNAGQPPAQLIVALADSSSVLSDAQRMRLVDHVVLAFEPAVAGTDPAQARLAGEARAIHESLEALSRREWPAVSEALRRVPHRSVFSPWAVFVKGVASFHAGETERSAKLLQGLPAGSVPAKAAQAYLCLLEGRSGLEGAGAPGTGLTAPAEAAVTAVCRLLGAGGVSGALMRADRLWRNGKPVESYRAARDGLVPFPSAGLDWRGALSEFYFKAPSGLPEHHRGEFLDFFADAIARNRMKHGAEAMFAHRMLALAGQAVALPDDLRADWEMFLCEHRAIHGANARLDSLACAWLGEQLAATLRSRGFFSGPPRMRDPDGAIDALRRSIELDPANLGAHLELCEVYDALKKRSERNRLLDEMTARFSDDKHVLVRAAQGCLERQAFGKGLDYLARARQLDQLDPRIPELTVAGLCWQARQQFQQRRPEKARQVLAQAETWLTDKADDFHRSRWTLLVRHGVMEQRWGDAPQAEARLTEAGRRAPNRAVMLLYAHLTEREYGERYGDRMPFLSQFREVMRNGAPRLGDVAVLLRLLEHWRNDQEEPLTFRENDVIARAIPGALKHPFTRAQAVEVVERGCDIPEFERPLDELIQELLRTDPLDPSARLWRIEVRGPWVFELSDDRAELQSIAGEATRRGDEASLRKARQMLRDLDQPPSVPFEPDFAGPEFDDEEDDFEPDDDPLPIDLPPEFRENVYKLIEALRDAPESEVRELREAATRAGVSDYLFEALIAASRIKPAEPLHPPPSKFTPMPRPKPEVPPPASKPSRFEAPVSDPDQMNLF